MITRRGAVRLLGSASVAAWLTAAHRDLNFSLLANAFAAKDQGNSTPPLAPGSPNSAERVALIDAFKKQSEGLEQKYEARTYKGDWTMPYRLFHPDAKGKLPLVVYLSGGGLGHDNLKQLQFGNTFGTRVWLLPENQKSFHVTSSRRRPIADGRVTTFRNSLQGQPRSYPDWAMVRAWRWK